MKFRIENLYIRISEDVCCSNFLRADSIDKNSLCVFSVKLDSELLKVQDDFCDILLYPGDSRELMENAVDLNRCDSNSRK